MWVLLMVFFSCFRMVSSLWLDVLDRLMQEFYQVMYILYIISFPLRYSVHGPCNEFANNKEPKLIMYILIPLPLKVAPRADQVARAASDKRCPPFLFP